MEVNRYRVSCCNGLSFKDSWFVKRHEENCKYNTNNRACATCKHCIKEPSESNKSRMNQYCDHYKMRITMNDKLDNVIKPQKHCPSWKSIDDNKKITFEDVLQVAMNMKDGEKT